MEAIADKYVWTEVAAPVNLCVSTAKARTKRVRRSQFFAVTDDGRMELADGPPVR